MALSRRQQQPPDLAETLAGFSFFRGLRSREVEELAELAICHEYPPNNILCYRGDPPNAVYLLLSGRAKISLTSDDGREVIVSMLGPGGICGLVAALDGDIQMARSVTTETSMIARFNTAAFMRWANGSPGARGAVMRELARRVRELYTKIAEHALMTARDRLYYALLEIADAEGQPGEEGQVVTFTRPTHRELAHRIGSSREVVTRLLAELREEEMFEDEGRIIRLPMSSLVLRDDS